MYTLSFNGLQYENTQLLISSIPGSPTIYIGTLEQVLVLVLVSVCLLGSLYPYKCSIVYNHINVSGWEL